MKVTMSSLVVSLAILFCAAGCGEDPQTQPKTPEAVQSFKGGPPPPGVMEKIKAQEAKHAKGPRGPAPDPGGATPEGQ